MAVEMLKPSPRGRWEKAAVTSQFWLLFVATMASSVVRDDLGFWGSTALTVVIMGLGSFLLVYKAVPERKERLARDAERGVIECALRYADSHPDSLRGRWLPGFAEIGTCTFKFQPDYIDKGRARRQDHGVHRRREPGPGRAATEAASRVEEKLGDRVAYDR